MDYGLIFLIIIVIVIIIAIILIIYANRNNTRNLLLTLPNYRIQNVATGGYLALSNLPNLNLITTSVNIPIYTLASNPFIPFWVALVAGDLTVSDPLGLWKINIIKQISVTVAEVQIINDVYFNESPNLSLGFLGEIIPAPDDPDQVFFTPSSRSMGTSTFIMTTIAPNTFRLTLQQSNFPIIIGVENNLLTYSTNVNTKPATFKLTLV